MSLKDKYSQWTLFLDRDGVINQHPQTHYVFNWSGFQFCPGAIEAITHFSQIFKYIIVVTNQQGIGKGLMTEHDLEQIHQRLSVTIHHFGGRIDAVYHCPELATRAHNCRKPSPSMAYKAQTDFPDIDFEKSIMVGDQITDIEFAENAGMKKVHVRNQQIELVLPPQLQPVLQVDSLLELYQLIVHENVDFIGH